MQARRASGASLPVASQRDGVRRLQKKMPPRDALVGGEEEGENKLTGLPASQSVDRTRPTFQRQPFDFSPHPGGGKLV